MYYKIGKHMENQMIGYQNHYRIQVPKDQSSDEEQEFFEDKTECKICHLENCGTCRMCNSGINNYDL